MSPGGAAENIDELLALDDLAFVCCAYKTLLHRDPDPNGCAAMLAHIRSGASKMRIVSAFVSSPEGGSQAYRLAGLRLAVFRYRLCRIPVAGRLYQLIFRDHGDSPALCRMRAAKNKATMLMRR
jgi:hypothetical protein